MLKNNKKQWIHTILSAIIFLSISLLIVGFLKKEEISAVRAPRLPKTRNVASEPQKQTPLPEQSNLASEVEQLELVATEKSFMISKEQIAKISENLFSDKMAEELIGYAIGKKFETENVVDIKVKWNIETKILGDGWKTSRFLNDSREQNLYEKYYKDNASFFRRFTKEKALESASWSEDGEAYSIDLDSEGHLTNVQYTSDEFKITFKQRYDPATNSFKRSYQSLIDGSRVFF